jgi:hypothetical protein
MTATQAGPQGSRQYTFVRAAGAKVHGQGFTRDNRRRHKLQESIRIEFETGLLVAPPDRCAGAVNQAFYFGVIFQTDPLPVLDFENKKGTMFCLCSKSKERDMLKTFVEEAAALASIGLFVGMIAVWAQLIPQL